MKPGSSGLTALLQETSYWLARACASETVLSTDGKGRGIRRSDRISDYLHNGDFSSTDPARARVGYTSGSPPKQTVVVDLGDNRMNRRFSRPHDVSVAPSRITASHDLGTKGEAGFVVVRCLAWNHTQCWLVVVAALFLVVSIASVSVGQDSTPAAEPNRSTPNPTTQNSPGQDAPEQNPPATKTCCR
jgi:hypothetical protein